MVRFGTVVLIGWLLATDTPQANNRLPTDQIHHFQISDRLFDQYDFERWGLLAESGAALQRPATPSAVGARRLELAHPSGVSSGVYRFQGERLTNADLGGESAAQIWLDNVFLLALTDGPRRKVPAADVAPIPDLGGVSVPLPAAAWTMCSAVMGLLYAGRRKPV